HRLRSRAGAHRIDRDLAPPREPQALGERHRTEGRLQGVSALSQPEAFARIRLLRSPNVGPVSYAQLLRRFGSAQAALEALPDLGRRGGRDYRAAPAERIEREVEA